MKKTIVILFLLIIALGCKGREVDYYQLNKGKLTGIWQDYPIMAAGWSDNYQFFPNKTFKFNYNQMDESKTNLSYSGTYEVHDKTITFYVTEKTIIDKKNNIISNTLTPPKVISKKISDIREEKIKLKSSIIEDEIIREVIKINEKKFYKIKYDPSNYH